MSKPNLSRRSFLKSTSAAAAAGMAIATPVVALSPRDSRPSANKNDRPKVGCIGLRYQGTVIADKSREYGDIVALCDVDSNVLDQARASFGSTAKIYGDYRDLLARDDIDVVTIGAPDHWHTKMLIDACRAGKDVYCEKPLTLTVDEGKIIRDVVRQTKRVVQVGSWQRSDANCRLAVELVRAGRIGKLNRVEVVLGKNETGGPFPQTAPPPNMNWDLWQGQTPDTPYIYQRSHYTFRWWYEYSGGQMTDWGAHHIDIAQWAINSYPHKIKTKATFPKVRDGYNVATDFEVTYEYPNGVVMTVSDNGRNGIMFVGDNGRVFVNRGTVSGKAVEELANDPFPRESYKLYPHDNLSRPARSGKLDAIVNHMGNFFDCVRDRTTPISDVESQHRSVTTCHLANISMWLNRPLNWNSESETFVDDEAANGRLKREQRQGFEIV